MAYLALFVALGGTGAYAANEWTGANIVDDSLTGADVKGKPGVGTTAAVDGTILTQDVGGQPASPVSGSPFIDGTLTTYDVRNETLRADDLGPNSVRTSEIANSAVTEGKLVPAEGWHEVPAWYFSSYVDEDNQSVRFDACNFARWKNYDADSAHNTAAFYRDPYGVVHLKGLVALPVDVENCDVIFQLQPGYRPDKKEIHAVVTNPNVLGRVGIETRQGGPGGGFTFRGLVVAEVFDPGFLSLDGITFRCAPSGQNGCP